MKLLPRGFALIVLALPLTLASSQKAVQQQGKTNQAAGTNNGVMNQGPCNVTVIDPKNSVIEIVGCKFDGLTEQQQASEIKHLLTRARQNGVALGRVQAALDQLIAQSRPANVQQNVDEGVLNSGTISAPLTFNDNRQYGAPGPPPPIVILKANAVIGRSQPLTRPEGMPEAEWISQSSQESHETFGENVLVQNPGYQFVIGVERTFPSPEFLITCDRPCQGTAAFPYTGPDLDVLVSGMAEPSNDFLRSPQASNMTLLQVSNPPTLVRGKYLVVKLRSLDSRPISATIRSYTEPVH